jgi:hypothetical protein
MKRFFIAIALLEEYAYFCLLIAGACYLATFGG